MENGIFIQTMDNYKMDNYKMDNYRNILTIDNLMGYEITDIYTID